MNIKNYDVSEKYFLEITKDPKVKELLSELKNHHYETYMHSIRVCFLCIDIGVGRGIEGDDLKTLAHAGLFHDIGKLLVPAEYLNREMEKLNVHEKKLFEMSPRFGFVNLRRNNLMDVSEITIAHHEFQKSKPAQRKGYDRRIIQRPEIGERRKRDSRKREFAQIVSIADILEPLLGNLSIEGKATKEKVDIILKKEFLGNKDYIKDVIQRI